MPEVTEGRTIQGQTGSGADAVRFGRDGLEALIAALRRRGFRVIGPRLSDDAVVYEDIEGVADLPAGWGDEQDGGHYRLRPRGDGALFGYSLAPQSWKRFLYPPRQKLFGARRQGDGFTLDPPDPKPAPMAFLGVRACERAAIALQKRVLTGDAYADSGYAARLADAVIVAVECAQAGDTCFCVSHGTGPAVTDGYDIKLVELTGTEPPVFLARAGSPIGADLLAEVTAEPAGAADLEAAARQVAAVAADMGRTLDTATARTLSAFSGHPRWDDVASRCMTCGNCTMVCPTCFCSTVEDVTDLKGDHAERWRRWDSCFTIDFTYIHGGAIRTGAGARYRQWITHKLSVWHDQFGSSGCVGCGRCITWCPVGIDITEEVRAIAASQSGEANHGAG